MQTEFNHAFSLWMRNLGTNNEGKGKLGRFLNVVLAENQGISCKKRKINEVVLSMTEELRTLLNTIDPRSEQMTIYLIRHDRFFETLLC